MKYLVLGAGGTGGIIGYHLAKAGQDLSFIARGDHLNRLKRKGLTVLRKWDGEQETVPVKAFTEAEWLSSEEEKPDVIFVCVKGYSLEDAIPFLQKAVRENTVIIPILNIYGTGKKLQPFFPENLVTDGCIYVSANITEPGSLLWHGPILRVLFGIRKGETVTEQQDRILKELETVLRECGIEGTYTDQIQRDALAKFSYVSPIGAAGLYYSAVAEDFQREGKERELYKAMIREITELAKALEVPFDKDYVEINLKILAGLPKDTTTSMQRDVYAGRKSEIDGLVYEVPRLAEQVHVPVPNYKMVAASLKERGL